MTGNSICWICTLGIVLAGVTPPLRFQGGVLAVVALAGASRPPRSSPSPGQLCQARLLPKRWCVLVCAVPLRGRVGGLGPLRWRARAGGEAAEVGEQP